MKDALVGFGLVAKIIVIFVPSSLTTLGLWWGREWGMEKTESNLGIQAGQNITFFYQRNLMA